MFLWCTLCICVAAVVIAVGDDKITVSLQQKALPAHVTLELVRLSTANCIAVSLRMADNYNTDNTKRLIRLIT